MRRRRGGGRRPLLGCRRWRSPGGRARARGPADVRHGGRGARPRQGPDDGRCAARRCRRPQRQGGPDRRADGRRQVLAGGLADRQRLRLPVGRDRASVRGRNHHPRAAAGARPETRLRRKDPGATDLSGCQLGARGRARHGSPAVCAAPRGEVSPLRAHRLPPLRGGIGAAHRSRSARRRLR